MSQNFSDTETASSSKKSKAEIRALASSTFGSPPLLSWEDPDKYEKLYRAVTDFIDPEDIFEAMQVRDLVDIDWELMRLREIQVKLIDLQTPIVAGKVLNVAEGRLSMMHFTHGQLEKPVREDLAGQEAAKKKVDELLARAGITRKSLAAASFAEQIDVMESIDRLIEGLERRRDARLREIERHRFAKSQRRRPLPRGDVTDLDPSVVAP